MWRSSVCIDGAVQLEAVRLGVRGGLPSCGCRTGGIVIDSLYAACV